MPARDDTAALVGAEHNTLCVVIEISRQTFGTTTTSRVAPRRLSGTELAIKYDGSHLPAVSRLSMNPLSH